DLERYKTEGQLELLPTRERMNAQADLEKLQANLGGVKNMQRPPDAMFVVDLKTEVIAVKEAQRLRIPIIGLVDTNCDPDGIEYVIPGNDDAIRSCALITSAIGSIVAEGQNVFRAEEEAARKQAEEQARKEAEEKARKEAEEQAAKEAEEQAAAQAAQAAAEAPASEAAAEAPAQPDVEPEPKRTQPDPKVTQKADREERHLYDRPGEDRPEPAAEDGEPLTNEALVEDGVLDPPKAAEAPKTEEPKTEEPAAETTETTEETK